MLDCRHAQTAPEGARIGGPKRNLHTRVGLFMTVGVPGVSLLGRTQDPILSRDMTLFCNSTRVKNYQTTSPLDEIAAASGSKLSDESAILQQM